jgi:hypothetical protein
MDKEKAKEEISKLVKEFSEYSKEKLDHKSENQIQSEFIDPLFEALGWNMRKDAEREEKVQTGRADYIMRIDNQDKVVIEAKKTSVSLLEKEGQQAVNYANHKKIKFAILTNFKEIKVYHALNRNQKIDNNLLKFEDKSVFRIPFDDFLRYFDKLWLLSRESFQREEINKLLSKKDERSAIPVDKSILSDLLNIRNWLSKELKDKRGELGKSKIDEAVQILIDRLIFMRSVEDRGLEASDFLLKIVNDAQKGFTDMKLWAVLKSQFKRFDDTYNSKLFSESLLEHQEIFFSEKVLIDSIKGLYFGTQKDLQLKYEFNLISSDLLGSIYEQYLGTILQETEKRVKLETKTGKRKKMGIYYTPSYIVDYIVKNTVGEYLKGKTIDEILEVRILDPACGSGSFLTRAFEEVCKVIEERLRNGEKSKKFQAFQEYNGKLKLSEKATIMKSCIYGVDLDEKAVELAQLNLLLKILEEEDRHTPNKRLPNLWENIKNGNSLIDDYKISDKAFKWNSPSGFKEIMDDGGFDVVIGNPPYGADLEDTERKWLELKFKLRSTDTAVLFMGLSTNLIKDGGIDGLIVPKPFVYSSTWREIRERLLNGLKEIVDCGKVWKEVKLEQVVYFYSKSEEYSSYGSSIRKGTNIEVLGKIDKDTFREFGFLLNGVSNKELNLGYKIKKDSFSMNDYVVNQRGAIYQKFVNSKPKSKFDYRVLGGKQVSRYFVRPDVKGYIEKEKVKDVKAFIKPNSILAQRIVAHVERPIGHIIIMASLSKDLCNKDHIIVDTINQLANKGKISSEFLVAILNSKIMSWYLYRFVFGKAIRTMQFDNPVTRNIPIKLPDKTKEKKIASLVNEMLSLKKQFNEESLIGREKERLERRIKDVDYEIDQEVYRLYDLTKEEIKIVEESLK